MAGELVELIRGRIDADFDGECHLTKDEALSIIGLIEHLRDNSRIEALERENATLREALDPFAKYKTADGLPNGFLRIPDSHPVLFNGLGSDIEFVVTVADFRRAAAAIRNMGGGE
ncbi:hypothetical protein [Shinella sp. M27]|uniref:hypothetical protein n=1 Tax=Shinella sp. M27 TaxID=3368614 RepID=UPI003B9F255D